MRSRAFAIASLRFSRSRRRSISREPKRSSRPSVSANEAPHFSERTCPGKVFLLGEYSVLAGGDALVLAVGPRFKLALGEGFDPAPQSPAGRLLSYAIARGMR